MIAVQIKIGQKNSQYTEIQEILGSDNEFIVASFILNQLLPKFAWAVLLRVRESLFPVYHFKR